MALRDWRKHNGRAVSSSNRLSQVSDSAVVLWRSLVDWQGDDGEFPWERPTIRSMLAYREWTLEQVEAALEELVKVGSVLREKDWVILYHGHLYNGTVTGGTGSGKPRHWLGWTCREAHVKHSTRDTEEHEKASGSPTEVQSQSTGLPMESFPLFIEREKELEIEREKNVGALPLKPQGANAPNPLVSETMKDLEALRRYPSPMYAAEAAAVKWMLDHQHPKADILACYAYLKQDPFWQNKPLTMPSVKTTIAEWVVHGRLAAPPPALFRPSPPPSANGPNPTTPDKYELERQRIAKLGVAPPRLIPKKKEPP